MNDAAEIFDRIAQEEGTTDQKLTKLAEGKINQRAQ
jgi:ferritin-like metal-binding protein YciE